MRRLPGWIYASACPETRCETPTKASFGGKLTPDETISPRPGNYNLADTDERLKLLEMQAQAILAFDERTKTLNQIDLMVKNPFAGETDIHVYYPRSLGKIQILEMLLAEKYGKPVTQKGECVTTVEECDWS